jgi:hypothetical protein
MKFYKLLSILFAIIPVFLFAQSNITGVVLDYDTKTPVPCATVYISGSESESHVKTNENGQFHFADLVDTDLYIEVVHDDYRTYTNESYNITEQGENIVILMYSYNSENYKITDVADQDIFDLSFAVNFFAPPINSSDELFSKNNSFQLYNINIRFKLANKLQMGFIYNPIKLCWNALATPSTGYIKERYFGAFTGLFVYVRYIPTTIQSTGGRGLFFDIGAGYNLPYYYAHSRFTDEYTRLSSRHIHSFNEFEAFARIGFATGAFKINYRLTDVLKGSYVETPKLSLGIELLIPASY